MQQQTSHRHTRQHSTTANALLLAGLAALVVALAWLGLWSTARAASHSGVSPDLNIVSLTNNIVTLAGTNWLPNSTVALSYSTSATCQPANGLKTPNNVAFPDEQGSFQVTYPWPTGITGGPFYFCANGRSADGTSAPDIPTRQAISVAQDGTVTFAPGSAATPTRTPPPPPTNTSTPANAATATAQAATATTQAATTTATPAQTATAITLGSGPGNKGASSTASSASILTLAIILALCLLVFLLLLYLIRVWLKGRQTP